MQKTTLSRLYGISTTAHIERLAGNGWSGFERVSVLLRHFRCRGASPELSHAIFEAVDAEIELNLRDGICYLECIRHASSLRDAVTSTIDELERSVTGLRVVRVETDDSNVIARINSDLLSAVGAP